MRLTTMTRGRLISSAYCQTFSVTTSTPETPSTTTSAASAADMAILASCANMVKPGESNRLIFVLCHSREAIEVEMVIWREISSSSWSVTVEPSSTRPSLGDRKSTRLNSSHTVISYAVFCLKKKNKGP